MQDVMSYLAGGVDGTELPLISVLPPPLLLGGLDLAIEGPSKAEIKCVDNKDGTCSVSYLPTLPGDYNILVKYNEDHIPGSPFAARITGERRTIPLNLGLRTAPFHATKLGQLFLSRSSLRTFSPVSVDSHTWKALKGVFSVPQRTTSGAPRSNWAQRQISPWTLMRRI